jgi:L-fucose mutarotase/ribose pyranase (RbsD/FucU family)
MLKGIPPIVGPDLLYVLQAMGHGDQITIVDGNYPGESAGPRLVRMDGHSATEVLDAVLTLMPLDDFVDDPAISMQVVGDAGRREPIMDEFEAIVKSTSRRWASPRSSASRSTSAPTPATPSSRPASGGFTAISSSRRA